MSFSERLRLYKSARPRQADSANLQLATLPSGPQFSTEMLPVETADLESPPSAHRELRKDVYPPSSKSARRFIWDTRFALAALDLFFVSLFLRAFLDASDGRLDFSVSPEAQSIVTAGVLTNLIFIYASGGYARDALLNRQFTAARLPIALGLAGIALFAVLHYGLATIFPGDALYRSIGRSTIISLITVGISLGATLASRAMFYALVRRGVFRQRILIVGTGKRARQLFESLTGHTHHSQLFFAPGSVVGGLSERHLPEEAVIVTAGEPLESIARNLSVDEIVVALDDTPGMVLERLLTCKTHGIRVTDVQTFVERETGRVDLNSLESSWLFCSDRFGLGQIDLGIKRLLDIGLSLILLLVALPVLLIAVVAIGVEGHGRIFFRQKRVTRNGRTFWLYKLRTMFADAEKSGPRWAEANDPRVTPVGRILRKCRIDEIPQLFNVLIGDMSLVGPRPERPVFVEQLSRELPLYDLRHTMKAGLTGWAQINYRYGASAADARRKLEYDLHYVKNYHLLLDISIIVQTFRVLLWGDGAR
jgi:sugar transferase (PEP-CTERM system associated)